MENNSVIKGLYLLRGQLSFFTELISPERPIDFGGAVATNAKATISEVEAHLAVFRKHLPLGFVEVEEIQDKWIEEVGRYAKQFVDMKDTDGTSLGVLFRKLVDSLKQMCVFLNNPPENDLLCFYSSIIDDYRNSHEGMKDQRDYLKWKNMLPQDKLHEAIKARVALEINTLETNVSGCHANHLFDVEKRIVNADGMARYIYFNPQRFNICNGENNSELTCLLRFILIMEWIAQDLAVLSDSDNDTPDVLNSEQAKKYWQRLQQCGFVDSQNQLQKGTTRQQAMYIAELFAEKMGIKSKWKTFEDLWGINNLAQEKQKCTDLGKLPARSDVIDKIFED